MKKGFLGNLKDTVAGAAQATVSAAVSTKDRAVSTASYLLGNSAPVPAPVYHEVEEGRIDPNSASAAFMREKMREANLRRAQAQVSGVKPTPEPAPVIVKAGIPYSGSLSLDMHMDGGASYSSGSGKRVSGEEAFTYIHLPKGAAPAQHTVVASLNPSAPPPPSSSSLEESKKPKI